MLHSSTILCCFCRWYSGPGWWIAEAEPGDPAEGPRAAPEGSGAERWEDERPAGPDDGPQPQLHPITARGHADVHQRLLHAGHTTGLPDNIVLDVQVSTSSQFYWALDTRSQRGRLVHKLWALEDCIQTLSTRELYTNSEHQIGELYTSSEHLRIVYKLWSLEDCTQLKVV